MISGVRLVLGPAAITLLVTVLRLAGELSGWDPRLFSRAPGGAFAPVGIVWLVPVFGAYFALALVRADVGPPSLGGLALRALAGLLSVPVSVAVSRALGLGPVGTIGVFGVASLAAAALAWSGWPALGRTLLLYGLLARLPVAAIMLVSIGAAWDTHYSKGPPGFPLMGVVATWFWIGLVPQLTLWIGFTLVVGALAGALTLAVARRGRPMARA